MTTLVLLPSVALHHPTGSSNAMLANSTREWGGGREVPLRVTHRSLRIPPSQSLAFRPLPSSYKLTPSFLIIHTGLPNLHAPRACPRFPLRRPPSPLNLQNCSLQVDPIIHAKIGLLPSPSLPFTSDNPFISPPIHPHTQLTKHIYPPSQLTTSPSTSPTSTHPSIQIPTQTKPPIHLPSTYSSINHITNVVPLAS